MEYDYCNWCPKPTRDACPVCKREFENRDDIFTHMKEVHGTDPASLSAHLQSIKESGSDTRFIVGGKPGTNQEIVMPNVNINGVKGNSNGTGNTLSSTIISAADLKNLTGSHGNQFQIVMNGEPLQIIPVDHDRGEISIDQDGRPIITDGQPFEVR